MRGAAISSSYTDPIRPRREASRPGHGARPGLRNWRISDIRTSMEASQQQLQAPAQRDGVIAGVAALLLLIGMPIGWLTGDTSTGDRIAFVVALLISLGLLAAVFLWLLPRERAAGRAARTSLILAIVGVVLLVVFWTGFCFSLAAGAVA